MNNKNVKSNKNAKANTKKRNNNQNKTIKSQLKTVTAHVDNGVFIYSEPLSVGDFAEKINKKPAEIVKYFFDKGMMINLNVILDEERLGELCLEFGLDFKKEKSITHENIIEDIIIKDEEKSLSKRPPIVTIMGHVDHGKTTLLDTIRNANVVGGEHGGITQHIGAYQVVTKDKEKITFVDTPGHEAFTQMRARGSAVTDIVIIVVAADDGVMPQTIEAIDHAKAANVPIIVFVNKMDKVGANPDNVMAQMATHELPPEEWGGTVPYVKGSAKDNKGIDTLLETILLLADMNELKANADRFAMGTVLESHVDKGLGPVATLIVQSGTLKIKDTLVVGSSLATVRELISADGKKIKIAGPSTPIMIHGLDVVPFAGDKFMVFNDEKTARQVADQRKKLDEENKRYKQSGFSLDKLSEKLKDGSLKQLNIILKADVQGTVEAIKGSLDKISVEGVKINILRASVGTITESDLALAKASEAIIVGFNVRPLASLRKKADDENIEIRLYNVIYNLIDEIKNAALGTLDPTFEEVVKGQAEVRTIFKHSAIGTIAGCFVVDGIILRNAKIRILREGIIIYDGVLASLKHVKNDVKEARQNTECGLTVKNYNDVKVGDVIESYVENMVKV